MHEVGLDVKPRLAAAGAANHQHILVPGRLGVFGPPGHGQAFGLGQQDVVFKLGVDVGGNVLGGAPPGRRVKILNTINFSKSMKYNPFVYIHSEKDVLKLVNTLIANTKGEGEKSAEDFWVKSERLFYTALIGYIWYEAPAEEMNFTTLLEMIKFGLFREPVCLSGL